MLPKQMDFPKSSKRPLDWHELKMNSYSLWRLLTQRPFYWCIGGVVDCSEHYVSTIIGKSTTLFCQFDTFHAFSPMRAASSMVPQELTHNTKLCWKVWEKSTVPNKGRQLQTKWLRVWALFCDCTFWLCGRRSIMQEFDNLFIWCSCI